MNRIKFDFRYGRLFAITFILILCNTPYLFSASIKEIFGGKDSLENLSRKKDYQINGFSFGFYYGNYFHNSKDDPKYYSRKTLHANLYNFGFKWRQSLFECRFGLGMGNTSEQRVSFYYSHMPPNYTITRYEDNVDEGLLDFNLQVRVNVSNHFRLTPYFWLGYNYISYEHDNYSNVSVYQFGFGLKYRLSTKFILEASTAISAWDDEDTSYEYSGDMPAGYIELGVYKTIGTKK